MLSVSSSSKHNSNQKVIHVSVTYLIGVSPSWMKLNFRLYVTADAKLEIDNKSNK